MRALPSPLFPNWARSPAARSGRDGERSTVGAPDLGRRFLFRCGNARADGAQLVTQGTDFFSKRLGLIAAGKTDRPPQPRAERAAHRIVHALPAQEPFHRASQHVAEEGVAIEVVR